MFTGHMKRNHPFSYMFLFKGSRHTSLLLSFSLASIHIRFLLSQEEKWYHDASLKTWQSFVGRSTESGTVILCDWIATLFFNIRAWPSTTLGKQEECKPLGGCLVSERTVTRHQISLSAPQAFLKMQSNSFRVTLQTQTWQPARSPMFNGNYAHLESHHVLPIVYTYTIIYMHQYANMFITCSWLALFPTDSALTFRFP